MAEAPDVGPVVAESIARFFAEPHNREVIAALREAGVHWPESRAGARRAGKLAGLTFVLTGTLPHAVARRRQGADRGRGRQGRRQRVEEDRLRDRGRGGRQQAREGAGTRRPDSRRGRAAAPACVRAGRRSPMTDANHESDDDAQDHEGGISGGGARHALPAGDQGESEGNAADRRQAADPVRGRGGRRRRHHRHDLHHRPQQARDRGPFRQGLRARDRARAQRPQRAARSRPGDHAARHQLHLHPADRGAGPRSRGAVRGAGRRRRAVRRAAGRRPDRRRRAGDEADDGPRRARRLRGNRRDDRGAGGDQPLWHRRGRPAARRRCGTITRIVEKPKPRHDDVDARGGRTLRADAARVPPPAHDAPGRGRRNPAHRRNRAALWPTSACWPSRSRADATIAAASSAISRRPSTSD